MVFGFETVLLHSTNCPKILNLLILGFKITGMFQPVLLSPAFLFTVFLSHFSVLFLKNVSKYIYLELSHNVSSERTVHVPLHSYHKYIAVFSLLHLQ